MVDMRLFGRFDVAEELTKLREARVNFELEAPPSSATG